MPKPYSQDLRDRVIDAVKRGEMSRRAAARRYEISESVAMGWRARACRTRQPSRLQADAAPGLSGGRAGREIGRHASGALRSPFGRARGQSRHLDDEPLLSPDWRHSQKKPLVAREQDRPDISPHRKRWRTYQGLIDPRRLIFIDETPAFAGAGSGPRPDDPPARLGAKGRAPHRQGPAGQVEDCDFSRRAYPRREIRAFWCRPGVRPSQKHTTCLTRSRIQHTSMTSVV